MSAIIIIAIVTVLNITLADIDAGRIDKGKRIYHGLNGLVYIAVLASAWLITRNWHLVACLIFNRLLVFNIALNVFRKLPPFYMPMAPKSVVDKIVKPIGSWVYLIYAIGFITLIFFV
jgi:hypothetical protein